MDTTLSLALAAMLLLGAACGFVIGLGCGAQQFRHLSRWLATSFPQVWRAYDCRRYERATEGRKR